MNISKKVNNKSVKDEDAEESTELGGLGG